MPVLAECRPATQLLIPDVSRLGVLEAALEYAEAGWYVLPLASGEKNPGSIVGKWTEESSRDPEVICDWFADYPDRGIALHVGRSGAVAFDLDQDELPGKFAADLRVGSFQHTRREGSRGHYIFATDPNDRFSNSAGAFSPYGEVRGQNGVIVVAPTIHRDAEQGGCYSWARFGAVPPLPTKLRECLSTPKVQSATATTAEELETFLDSFTTADRPEAVGGPLGWFDSHARRDGQCGGGSRSRHEAVVEALCWGFREAYAGLYPARQVYDSLRAVFIERFAEGEVAEGRDVPEIEFDRAARYAAAQAVASDSEETRAKVGRDDRRLEEEFWAARPELEKLRDYALARIAEPWAVLGAVLARTLAMVPPDVVLPPTVGGYGSLNLFVNIVGPSGSGKGTAMRSADDFLRTNRQTHEHELGSGEGIAKQYAYYKTVDKKLVLVPQRDRVLFSVDEIDNLTAVAGRSGATLMPELRKAWSGERLGKAYADRTKDIPVQPHRYRLCLVMGVQEARAEAMFADADGGTPQRFLWMPAMLQQRFESEADLPELPEPLDCREWRWGRRPNGAMGTSPSDAEFDVTRPMGEGDFRPLRIPERVRKEIRDHRLRSAQGQLDPLDGHRYQVQLKVSAGLMFLAGREREITEEDWELAGAVMAKSEETRRATQDALRQAQKQSDRARGRREAARAAATDEEKELRGRVARKLLAKLAEESDSGEGWIQWRALIKLFHSSKQSKAEEVLQSLISSGQVESEEGKAGNGRLVKRCRIVRDGPEK
ncbi:bifunctional DNA primase/polymerase [Dietzia lutea]|uniref:bifunctional DNA primase/polymerase n=1 Tax=Dietzia lutea TaxID=546160 RepID=UPI000D54DA27|nr:bifunctional DNA primase/polymerase [Dietzia lutea]